MLDFLQARMGRPTKAEQTERETFVQEQLELYGEAMTIRQIYYRGRTADIWENGDYDMVANMLKRMRTQGLIDYGDIHDPSRRSEHFFNYANLDSFVENGANNYKPRIFLGVVCWIEKDTLWRQFEPICNEYRVPLWSSKGFASDSHIYSASQWYPSGTKVLYFGDFDPSGILMEDTIRDGAYKHGREWDVTREALTYPAQVTKYNLTDFSEPIDQTLRPNGSYKNTHVANYLSVTGGLTESWEIEAFDPDTLRSILRDAIESNIDMTKLEAALEQAENEKEQIHGALEGLNYE